MRILVTAVAVAGALALGGCTERTMRTTTEGGILGGGVGLVAGALYGHPGQNAARGALIGATAGAIIGTLHDARDADRYGRSDGGYRSDRSGGGDYYDRSYGDRGNYDQRYADPYRRYDDRRYADRRYDDQGYGGGYRDRPWEDDYPAYPQGDRY